MVGSKGCSTPAAPGKTLSCSDGEAMENSSFCRSTIHSQACKRVLRYLKSTITYGVIFQKASEKELTLKESCQPNSHNL